MQFQHQSQPIIGPKTVVLYRTSEHGFGFTLRHFIVYPPDSSGERAIASILNLTQPMDTVFVKEVRINGPAHIGGLRAGDRLLSVNGMPVAGTAYHTVVRAIQQSPPILKLIVVPKDCDILQTLFGDSAHNPETNQRPRIYGNTQDFSLGAMQSNVNNSMSNVRDSNSLQMVMPNPPRLQSERIQGFVNDLVHRHSFNESIYSEPYSSRFAGGTSSRLDPTIIPIGSGATSVANRIAPLNGNRTNLAQNGASQRDKLPATTSASIVVSNSNGALDVHPTYMVSNKTEYTKEQQLMRGLETNTKLLIPNTAPLASASEQISEQSNQMLVNNELDVKIYKLPEKSPSCVTTAQVETCEDIIVPDQSETAGAVFRRPKLNSKNVDRPVRRISYLRATANEISAQEANSIETDIDDKKDALTEDIQQFIQFIKCSTPLDKSIDCALEGKLNIKVAYIAGKRNPVRPWHRVSAQIRGHQLQMIVHIDSETNKQMDVVGVLDLHQFHVCKSNYTKRKHVFKLTTVASGTKNPTQSWISPTTEDSKTEFLIQADDQAKMDLWKSVLQKTSRAGDDDSEQQQPLPQTPKEKSSSSTSTFEKELSLSKSRTWKDLVARQFRRIHGHQPSSPDSRLSGGLNVASIGVTLSQCPISEKHKYVPLILARCTEIVESKGLHIVGIYRIPGNTAAISALTELVNKGFDEQTLSDPRWDDVNVVSSLLKLFLRRLPEALLPNDMYKSFIEADKETGQERILALKELIVNLPIQFYESLKHLMRHLNLVSRNCATNLMEPKNLAIIFGPSVVRTSNETLETVVKDMKHQCRIIEALVLYYKYFFSNGEIPVVYEQNEQSMGTAPKSQTNMLLDNVSKIEPYTDHIEKSRFVFKLVQAARSRKTKKKSNHQRSAASSMTLDTLSFDSSTSTEYRNTPVAKVENLTDVDGIQSSLSPDDSADMFSEDNGSMSLATLIPALEDKFYALRNASFDSESSSQCITLENDDDGTDATSPLTPSLLRNHQLISLQPLTLGDESIPYADDSPDQPTLPSLVDKSMDSPATNNFPIITSARFKSWNPTTSGIGYGNRLITSKSYRTQDCVDAKSKNSISSDDDNETDDDESNTSDLADDDQTIRINREVIREMNRILTTLERKATKLNRSLSLNIKYHHNNECCCCSNNNNNSINNSQHVAMANTNSNHSSCRSIVAINRYSLTKDEKTDKNINKKRQIQDNNSNTSKNKRYSNRPIKRRHTVGGIHYYGYNAKTNATKSHQVDATNNNNNNNR